MNIKTAQPISRYIKNTLLYVASILLVVGIIPFASPSRVAAAEDCDKQFLSSNNITFSGCDSDSTTCSTSASNSVISNKDYAGNVILTDAQLQAIESNRPFYEKAATASSVPWQLLAAMHIRETGLKRYGPTNGDGPYQIVSKTYRIGDNYSDEEFQTATNDAAEFLKAKAGGRDLSTTDGIKYVFFAYNGAASKYVTQAKNLGFTDEQAANGEGSPYVMNRADEKRDPTAEPTKSNNTWGQFKEKNEVTVFEYPANSDYGAYVYYAALTDSAGCTNTSATAQNGDANAMLALFAEYMKSHDNKYATYYLGDNGCTTLAWWYIGEYTNLTYGRGNGEAVVRNLVSANPGLQTSDKPVAPSVYSVAPNVKAWGASGIAPGHVGIVISVDEQAQTATVIQTGSSFADKDNRGWVQTYKYPTSGVSFTYVGDHLK